MVELELEPEGEGEAMVGLEIELELVISLVDSVEEITNNDDVVELEDNVEREVTWVVDGLIVDVDVDVETDVDVDVVDWFVDSGMQSSFKEKKW